MTPFDCPRCGTVLTMSDRQGIEIDYCPQCRGVWLDRGELDKILERAAAMSGPGPEAAAPQGSTAQGLTAQGAMPGSVPTGGWARPAPEYQPPPSYPQAPPYPSAPAYPPPQAGWRGRDDEDDDDDRTSHHRSQGYRGKPRKNWLSDLFD